MRSIALAVIAIVLASCIPMARDLPDESKLTEADKALATEFSSAIDATEWLIDTKHTLRGLPMDRTSELLKTLLDEGATELKVNQIVPDANDPSFQSAGMLYVKLPRSEKGRNDVLKFVGKITGIEMQDRGQSVVEISLNGAQ